MEAKKQVSVFAFVDGLSLLYMCVCTVGILYVFRVHNKRIHGLNRFDLHE